MIEVTTGDIFQTDAQALVNPTNCVGPMGAGLARQFANRYPANTAEYRKLCRQNQVRPGTLVWHDTGKETPRWIINLATKDHYRNTSKLEYVRTGVEQLAIELTDRRIASVAIPALGAGLGGLHWHEVKPVIIKAMQDLDGCRVILLEPASRR